MNDEMRASMGWGHRGWRQFVWCCATQSSTGQSTTAPEVDSAAKTVRLDAEVVLLLVRHKGLHDEGGDRPRAAIHSHLHHSTHAAQLSVLSLEMELMGDTSVSLLRVQDLRCTPIAMRRRRLCGRGTPLSKFQEPTCLFIRAAMNC